MKRTFSNIFYRSGSQTRVTVARITVDQKLKNILKLIKSSESCTRGWRVRVHGNNAIMQMELLAES